MSTPNPLLLDRLLERLQAAPWLVEEAQRRLVLLLNHVLLQEPEACARLARHRGQTLQVVWRSLVLHLVCTPAGLLDLAAPTDTPDLRLQVTEASPLLLAQAAARGDKPAVSIAGDIQLAAEVGWLVEHVRWDVEQDLSRLLGDVVAHTLVQTATRAAQALRQLLGAARPGPSA